MSDPETSSPDAGSRDHVNLLLLDASPSATKATSSIKGASVIDIESGQMVIDGDKSGMIHDYIAASKITGMVFKLDAIGSATIRIPSGRLSLFRTISPEKFAREAEISVANRFPRGTTICCRYCE